ncbi:MAG: plasmid pRiA4b ORF-3 family protein [Planctomycetales bacterium]|nr:plasmid pRiA4b ORF-3 family protein [Planctomycetales bacterium]
MPAKKQIQPGERVPLKLTATERKLILAGVTCLDPEYEQIIQDTPAGQPVMLTLDDLDDFGGYVAAEANHCDDDKKQAKLDAVLEKIQSVLDRYTDDEPPQSLKIEDARQEKLIADQAVQIAEFAARALVAAKHLRIKTKPLDHFWLAPGQRDVLLLIPGVSKAVRNKLAKEKPLTVAEVASMTMALAEDLLEGEPRQQAALLLVAKHVMDRLQQEIMAKAEPTVKTKSERRLQAKRDVLYQFKITLLEASPPVWRRIQVQDCALDKLHEHIQTAMGWTNSHLHQFDVKGVRYGDPGLLDDDFEDFEFVDSTVTMVSDILPKAGKRFAFKYEYDFGDGWEHEILYEGSPPLEKRQKYPLCVEGERACPPEDVGGVWGYAEYLEALADPKHECHADYIQWSGPFDPDDFDPTKATRVMRKGLPDWRSM